MTRGHEQISTGTDPDAWPEDHVGLQMICDVLEADVISPYSAASFE